ncbi:oxygen tolerance protein BatD [Ancylobacter aquaticus]|uniref:Oxygen tolerance protein BatD n=1 Tax=Ancylobacter aquaticus TaxID=100 RepID=A0A4R1I2J9_ANCAQ|nr:BatD family protein [Ancylobacter aquaticus]TCK29008.1 oxygen tolerance protein BatD [Ancylobacter aquaticus]
MVRWIVLLLLLIAGDAHADSLRLLLPEGAHPVAGEMIPVTLRGEYTSRIALETLNFPGSAAYDWMQLARDQWRDEEIAGRTVRVFERRLAVFPRHAGTLTLGPVTHHLTVVDETNLRAPLDVTAAPVTLAVAPYPGEGTPLSARSLTVEDTLSAAPGELRDGETLVRRVTLKAQGALPHMLPPRPILREPWLISFAAPEQREMLPTPAGPVTTVVWEWHLRPTTGEPGVLPPVPIAWFDTAAREMRMAEITALPFGYASFRDNRSGTERLPAAESGAGWLALVAGGLTGISLCVTGLAPRRRAQILRDLRRLSPFDPTRRWLKRAARTGDLFAIRRAAEAYLRRRRELNLPVNGCETTELDAMLYGRTADATGFDREAVIRTILAHAPRDRRA